MSPVFLWWLVIQAFGLAALPITRRVFRCLPDGGYAFARIVGLLLVSYLLWLGAITGVLVNDLSGIFLALMVVTGISAALTLRQGLHNAFERLRDWWLRERSSILVTEILFLLAFAGWATIRAYAPDKILPSGGEKYMEIAFLNGVLNSPRFPPIDPWLAGYSISYYYFGYVMMAVVTRLSGVLPGVGFDLYDALTFALTVTGAYGVVANLVRASGGSQRGANTAGGLAGVFVAVLGNLEGLIHSLYSARLLPSAWVNWLAIPDLNGDAWSGSLYPGNGWWWWRASRVINDLNLQYQPVPYQPIDEFPFFSFLLGDNHPHKLALPFVLLAIGLAFNALLAARTFRSGTNLTGWKRWLPSSRGELGLYGFYALALGSLTFLNTWDFPIYLGLVVLAIGLGMRWGSEALDLRLLGKLLWIGFLLSVGSILLYLYFFLSFSSQAGGVLPYIFPPTRLPQYMVMFGPFLLILMVFLPLLCWQRQEKPYEDTERSIQENGQSVRTCRSPWRETLRAWLWTAGLLYGLYLPVLILSAAVLARIPQGSQALAAIEPYTAGRTGMELVLAVLSARITNPWLFLLLSSLIAMAISAALRLTAQGETRSVPALFAGLLALVGLGLSLSVEFFYLRDSFGLRMNTIFKFYYQAWVLMACASAFGLWWVSKVLRPAARTVFQFAAGLLIAAGLVYPLMATYSRVEGFKNAPILDATATVSGAVPNRWAAQPDDWAAIQWLLQNEPGESDQLPILLEAPGESYTNGSRVSAFTGFPTLLGWTGHEWQWRGNNLEQNRREPAIRTIYTTSSGAQALGELKRWNVRYVIIGEMERGYINKTCSNPETACDPRQAIEKFDTILTPVFQQGGTAIFAVPQ